MFLVARTFSKCLNLYIVVYLLGNLCREEYFESFGRNHSNMYQHIQLGSMQLDSFKDYLLHIQRSKYASSKSMRLLALDQIHRDVFIFDCKLDLKTMDAFRRKANKFVAKIVRSNEWHVYFCVQFPRILTKSSIFRFSNDLCLYFADNAQAQRVPVSILFASLELYDFKLHSYSLEFHILSNSGIVYG